MDDVLGYLESDTKTLKACCLLSRSWSCWTAAGRLLLFQSLTVHIDRRGHSIDAFIKFLTAAPHIGEVIQELCLQNARREIVKRPIDVVTFQTIMRKLPRLKSLSLQHLQYGTNCGWPTREFELDSLSIRCLTRSKQSYRTFLELVASFSRLGELHLQMSPFYGAASYVPSPTYILPIESAPIRTLVLDGGRYPADTLICDSLRLVPGSLQCLSLTCGTANDIPDVRRVLKDHGAHLTSLQMHFPGVRADGEQLLPDVGSCAHQTNAEPWQEAWREADFGVVHAITSLTLIVDDGPLNGIICFLACMPVKKIRRIEIVCASPERRRSTLLAPDEFFWEDSTITELRGWPAVDDACSQFPNLKSVLLRWNPGAIYRDGPWWANEPDLQVRRSWGAQRRTHLKREFPKLLNRGLLRFE